MISADSRRRRHFVILQGLATPFFFRLSQRLRAAGHQTTKIHVCGADLAFWPGRAVLFRGRREHWPAFLAAHVDKVGATDIVLFGDCRPYHREAVAQARQRGMPVHVFEEGYVRPGYITLEEGGTNGYTRFPRDPESLKRQTKGFPDHAGDAPPAASSFANRAGWDVLAQTLGLALTPLFPHYRWHGKHHPFIEYAGWLRRFVYAPYRKAASKRVVERLLASGTSFFLMPLQLDSDYQIRVHSRFATMLDAVEVVMASFACSAPRDSSLVLKLHPLDPGLIPWEGKIRDLAERHGIAARVHFIASGDLSTLANRAEGMVVVNSTAGLEALRRGLRLKALGTALYDLPGLAFQGSLADFWSDDQRPDAGLVALFLNSLIIDNQVRGDFFSFRGIRMSVDQAATRLLNPTSSAV